MRQRSLDQAPSCIAALTDQPAPNEVTVYPHIEYLKYQNKQSEHIQSGPYPTQGQPPHNVRTPLIRAPIQDMHARHNNKAQGRPQAQSAPGMEHQNSYECLYALTRFLLHNHHNHNHQHQHQHPAAHPPTHRPHEIAITEKRKEKKRTMAIHHPHAAAAARPEAHATKLRQLLLHGGRLPLALLRTGLTGPLSPRVFSRALARLRADRVLYAHVEEGWGGDRKIDPFASSASSSSSDDDEDHEISAADFYPGPAAREKGKRRRGDSTRWTYTFSGNESLANDYGYECSTGQMAAAPADRRLLAGSIVAVCLLTLISFVVIAQHLDM